MKQLQSGLRCSHCKSTTARSYVKLSTSKEGTVYHYCTDCNTARLKKYYAKTGGVAAKRAVAVYQFRNPERVSAWKAAKAIPLQPCQVCDTTEHVHRHHPDPADKLTIEFLCAYHHKRRHIEMKAGIPEKVAPDMLQSVARLFKQATRSR